MKRTVIAIASVLAIVGVGCAEDSEPTPRATVEPVPAPTVTVTSPPVLEEAESEGSWEEFELELFEILAEPEIAKIMDHETCELVALVGPQPFVDAYREGWEQNADWRPEFNSIMLDIIDRVC